MPFLKSTYTRLILFMQGSRMALQFCDKKCWHLILDASEFSEAAHNIYKQTSKNDADRINLSTLCRIVPELTLHASGNFSLFLHISALLCISLIQIVIYHSFLKKKCMNLKFWDWIIYMKNKYLNRSSLFFETNGHFMDILPSSIKM